MANNPYASLLGNRAPLSVLDETPRRLESMAGLLGTNGLDKPWAPGKWTGTQIVCHFADCEIAFGFRYRQAIVEPHHTVQPFDQDGWAKQYPLSSELALQAFSALRKWNLALLEKACSGVLEKPISHPERGQMTFGEFLKLVAGHDLNHLQQLDKLVAERPLA